MSDPILQTQDLQKSFPTVENQSLDIIQGVSFSIHKGESISIRGRSGSGKTTLLNLLAGLEKNDHGDILWEGESITHLKNHTLSQKRKSFMGFIFQSYYLIPELTAHENVLMSKRLIHSPSRKDKDRATELLEQVGLSDRSKHLPNKLSGGERQRVALARALMNQPAIILADEPTGNLDEDTGDRMIELLMELCLSENTSLLLVTHNSEHAKRTQRQLRLRKGKLMT